MISPIYFSGYIRPAIKKIKFSVIVLWRFCKIAFRRNKQLVLLELDYGKKHQFNVSLLVIRYQFKNALWHNFKDIKQTTNGGVIVLNILNAKKKPVVVTVYGFFCKKIFLIDITPEMKLHTNSFLRNINKVHHLQSNISPIRVSKFLFSPALFKIRISYPTIVKPSNNIQVVYASFNQT